MAAYSETAASPIFRCFGADDNLAIASDDDGGDDTARRSTSVTDEGDFRGADLPTFSFLFSIV